MNDKRKKGFTLIELLSTIAIIGTIMGIASLVYLKLINNSQNQGTMISKSNILNTARIYVMEEKDNIIWNPTPEEYVEHSNQTYACISLNELKNKGLIEQATNIKATDIIIWKNKYNNTIISEEFDEEENLCTNQNSVKIPNSDICIPSLEYTGETQTLAHQTDKYSLTGNEQKDAGTYTITATLKEPEFYWKDGTTEEKTFNCKINKKQIHLDIVDTNGNDYNIENPTINIEDIYIGQIITLKIKSDTLGTLSVRTSNHEYYDTEIIGSPEITDINTEKELNITFKSTRNAGGNITITLTPNDTNNYYSTPKTIKFDEVIKKEYNIKYDPNGGEGSVFTEKIIFNRPYTTKNPNTDNNVNYKNKYKILTSWNTKKNGTGITWNFDETKIYNSTEDITLYAQWTQNKVNITYNVNGGKVTEKTISKDGSTEYFWTSNVNGDIYRNNNLHQTIINYGNKLSTSGLNDYNNPKYLNITKTGYKATKGAEWICLSGDCTIGKTYDQANDYNYDDFCNASTSDCTVVLGVNWESSPNKVNITYNVNGGKVTEKTISKDGSTEYFWTCNVNGDIYRNNKLHQTIIPYGSSLGDLEYQGLNDYNNPKYLNITKTGYKATKGAEWICLSGDCTIGKTYDQANDYNYDDFCNASTSDCTVVLGVNWESSPNKVNITYNVNGGKVTGKTIDKDGVTEYFWTISANGNIYRNNNLHQTIINYGNKLSTSGLNDYNNPKYLNITKTGYKATKGAEWICLSGDCAIGKTYDQSNDYNYDDFCNASTSDCTVVLGVNWEINKVNIIYNVNGGNVTKNTTDKDGIKNYTWTTNANGDIYINNNLHQTVINYGNKLSASGLNDRNNKNYLEITKTGYTSLIDTEWICLSGDCTKGKTFDNYTAYNHNDFCDASTGDCTVVLGVNWNQEYTSFPGDRYYCTNKYDNQYRLSIFDNVTCNATNCNYTKINGLTSSNINTCNNTSLSNNESGYCKMIFTPTWSIERTNLSPTISKNCISTMYVRTNSGNGLNCRSGASTKTDRVAGVVDCAKIQVSKTTTKYDSSNNWYYSSDAECYLSGKYLYTSQQCSSGGGGGGGNISTSPNPVMCGKCSSDADCGSNMTCSGTCTGTNGSYNCCVVKRGKTAISMCN